jgi:hypothetical protein
MNARILAPILAILILAAGASGQLIVNTYTNDFTLSSPANEQIKMCSCQAKADTLRIENTGQFAGTYELRVETSYPGTVRLSRESARLEPQHAADIFVYLEGSCGVAGTYAYLVTATNNYGRIEQLSRTIRIDPCQTGSLDVDPQEGTVGLCDDATFLATVRNVGTYPDTFTLKAGDDQRTVAEAYLQPGDELEQDVNVRYACTEFGERQVPFTLLANGAGVQAQLSRKITITNEYDATLGVDSQLHACARTSTRLPVTVSNTAPAEDEITLVVDGPVAFEGGERERTINLGANASEQLLLEVPPSLGVGAHEISLLLRDARGGVSKERTAQLTVENCYDPAVEIRTEQDKGATAQDTDCCGPKTYWVNVRNDGDREQEFRVDLDGPSFLELDETSVRLRPSENANIALEAHIPCSDEAYDARITVYPDGQPQASASASLHIESVSTRACYQVSIDEDELDARTDAQEILLTVRSAGIRAGEYTIATNSTLFSIREEQISLSPGKSVQIHLEPAVNLTEQELGRYLVFPTFTLEERGVSYEESVGIELRGFTWLERMQERISRISLDGWTLCARIVLVLFLIFLILALLLLLVYAGRARLAQSLPRHVLLWTRTLLLLALALLLVALACSKIMGAGQNGRAGLAENVTLLEMRQGEQLRVDLDEYFEDPDGDELSYAASQPPDIDVRIDGSQMTLTPDPEFVGENALVLTVSDAKGGVLEGPLFVLRVARDAPALAIWVDAWCVQLELLLLIGVALMLFLLTLTIPQRRQDLRAQNVLVVVPQESAARRTVKRKVAKKARKAASRKGAPKRARRSAKAQARAIAITPSRAVAIQRIVTPERQREGQTVNIAVGSPLAVPGARPEEIALIGSKTGNTVHTPYCMIARRIPKAKRIAFGSKKEALDAGLVPCRGCRPF